MGDLDASLQAAGGLRRPHLDLAMAAASDPRVHGPLVKLHSDVWQGLIDQMGKFIRKRDYRFSGETITHDKTAAMEKAIRVLTGCIRQFPRDRGVS